MINLYVSKSGSDTNDGLSLDKAKLTIQNALSTCKEFGETYIINISQGEYTEQLSFSGNTYCSISLKGTEGVIINGGMSIYCLDTVENITINLGSNYIYLYDSYSIFTNGNYNFVNCIINGSGSYFIRHYSSSNYNCLSNIKDTELNYTGNKGYLFDENYLMLDNVKISGTSMNWFSSNLSLLSISNMTLPAETFKFGNYKVDKLILEKCVFDYNHVSYYIKSSAIKSFEINNCTISNYTKIESYSSSNDNRYISVRELFYNQENANKINDHYYSLVNKSFIQKVDDNLNVKFEYTTYSYLSDKGLFILRFYLDKIEQKTITIPIQAQHSVYPSTNLSIGIFKPDDYIRFNSPIENIKVNSKELQEFTITFTPEKEGEYFLVFNYDGKFSSTSSNYEFNIGQIEIS